MTRPGALALCCSDMPAPPLFWTEADGSRHGYEPAAARAVAEAMGLDSSRAPTRSSTRPSWCAPVMR